jgi:hypothetical protein
MGSFFSVPETLQTQESVEREAQRLLQSYKQMLEDIQKNSSIDSIFIHSKHRVITHQWAYIKTLLHSPNKEKYNKLFQDYINQYKSWKSIGLLPINELETETLNLEEPLLGK